MMRTFATALTLLLVAGCGNSPQAVSIPASQSAISAPHSVHGYRTQWVRGGISGVSGFGYDYGATPTVCRCPADMNGVPFTDDSWACPEAKWGPMPQPGIQPPVAPQVPVAPAAPVTTTPVTTPPVATTPPAPEASAAPVATAPEASPAAPAPSASP